MNLKERLFADLSSANTRFDARAYQRAGHRMIAVKATEGHTYVNPQWAIDVNEAHRRGLIVTHYHFGRYDRPEYAHMEADHFIHTIAPHLHEHDRVAVDLEVTPLPDDATMHHWLKEVHDRVWWHTGRGIVGYANLAWLRFYAADVRGDVRSWWLADWAPLSDWPIRLREDWAHQFTDGEVGPTPHALAGIGRCDISIMGHDLSAAISASLRSR